MVNRFAIKSNAGTRTEKKGEIELERHAEIRWFIARATLCFILRRRPRPMIYIYVCEMRAIAMVCDLVPHILHRL